jgi:uncharacterized membrane protein
MADIRKLFTELRWEVAKTLLVDVALSATIVFLALHLVLSFFGIPFWISAIIAFIFLIFRFRTRMARFQLKLIEDKNTTVKEMLRTARDNINDTSIMGAALFADVIDRMRNVNVGAILNMRALTFKAIAVGILSVAVIMSSGIRGDHVLVDVPKAITGIFHGSEPGSYQFGTGLKEDEGIYGAANLVNLGDNQLEIRIDPKLSDLDLSEEKKADETDFTNAFPVEDLGATAEEAYQEDFGSLAELAAKYTIEIRS